MNPVGLIDMDGTIADLMGALDTELRKLQAPCEEPLSNNIFDYYHQPFMQARIRLIKNQEGFWRNLPEIPQGMDIVHAMHDLKYEIHVLTKGPRYAPIAWREKIEWCDRVFAEHHIPHQTTITENKGLVYGRVLVDDFPDYILAWLKYRPRGFVFMPASPWNEKFVHPQVMRYQGTHSREGFQDNEDYKNMKRILKDIREIDCATDSEV